MKNLSVIVGVLVVAGIAAYLGYSAVTKDGSGAITNFQECAETGNPVMESYPRQCRSNGQTFAEDIGNEMEKRDLIRIDSPRPNETITSPLTITGEARGYWFFEASFPVELQDENGVTLVQHYAEAQDEWMTEEFVPFRSSVSFEKPATKAGVLILHKDNPSGLPEHADQLRVPVRFE